MKKVSLFILYLLYLRNILVNIPITNKFWEWSYTSTLPLTAIKLPEHSYTTSHRKYIPASGFTLFDGR